MVAIPQALLQFAQQCLSILLPASQKAAGAVLITLKSGDNAADDGPSKTEQFQQLFSEKLRQGFAALTDSKLLVGQTNSDEGDDSLDARIKKYSLLGKEELEAQIAVERFSRQIFEENQVALAKLTLRIEDALSTRIDLANLPLHPRQLSIYYSEICSKLARTDATRDAALNQWIKTLETHYPQWLNALNDALVNQGILAHISEDQAYARLSGVQREQKAKEMRNQVMEQITGRSLAEGESFSGQEILQSLTTLLQQAQMQNSPAIQRHVINDNAQGSAINYDNLVTAIHRVTPPTVPDNSGYREIDPFRTLSELIQEQTEVPEHKLDERSKSSIAMLSIMFENLLSEENLAPQIRPLLSDLQIPVLQQALKDDDFFSSPDNPAQQFINEIARAGTQWIPNSDAKRDIFYKKIAGIVETVCKTAPENPNVFAENLPILNEFIYKEERRSAKLEERLIQNELAQAKRAAAQKQTEETINQCFGTTPRAPAVEKFLKDNYQKVLLYALNKAETPNPLLDQALLNLNQLALAAQGHEVDLRQLFQSLNVHLAEQGLDRQTREQDLQALLDQLKLARKQQLQRLSDEKLAQQAQAEAALAKQRVQERATLATVEATPLVVSEAQDIDDAFKEQAQNLPVNVWFRYRHDDQISKVKLAAILRQQQHYIFVNRDGQKIITTDVIGVADLLRRGVLQVIEDTMLFDRALERVVKSLRTA